MKLNEKKTEELMTSLSPRYITEFASPAPAEKKSHPEWIVALVLVLCLSMGGLMLAGTKANAGNAVPSVKVTVPTGTTPLEVKNITIQPGYQTAKLYVTGVNADHPEYVKACEAIREAAESLDQKNKELGLSDPNYFREVDLNLGAPLFYFAGAHDGAPKEAVFSLYFVFPVIKDGRLFTTIAVQRNLSDDGNAQYSLVTFPQNGYLPFSDTKLPEDEKERIYQLNTTDIYAYEALSGLTSAQNPLYITGLGRIDVGTEGFAVIGNTLYRLGEASSESDTWFENRSAGLDKTFLTDMGFELEVKVWPLGE